MSRSDRPIRVGVNLLWLRPGQVGGTESYARRVIEATTSSAAEETTKQRPIEWHLFGTSAAIAAVRPAGGSVVEHSAPAGFADPARRVVLERSWLRAKMRGDLDVVHHPGGTVPFGSSTPTAVTVHDLQPLDDPQNFGAIKRRFLARAIPRSVDRADLVLTPSDWVREGIIDRFDLAEEKVMTVSAYADRRASAGEPETVESIRRAGPYCLYPAMTMRHKNHRVLFRAFGLAEQVRPDLQLVCVGAVGRDHDEILTAARLTSGRIRVLGHVTREELDALFEHADLLVFPSRYEGFGLPVLEAQLASLPVASSTAAALPEVAGGSAILLDPDDVEGWSTVMAHPPEADDRRRLIRAGLENAARYTPRSTARQLRGAYERLTQ